MSGRSAGKLLRAGAMAAAALVSGAAQAADEDHGPPPAEDAFYEAADRGVRRMLGRGFVIHTNWDEPRVGTVRALGETGYIACGDVIIRGQADPLKVMAVWLRGEVRPVRREPLEGETGAFWTVPFLDNICAEWVGGGGDSGQPEGERFEWGEAATEPSSWREVSTRNRQFRARERNEFGGLSHCVRLPTRPGRTYRVRVTSAQDLSLAVLTDRNCSSGLVVWNEDAAEDDVNPLVVVEAPGALHALVTPPAGSTPAYVLSVEEAVQP